MRRMDCKKTISAQEILNYYKWFRISSNIYLFIFCLWIAILTKHWESIQENWIDLVLSAALAYGFWNSDSKADKWKALFPKIK